MSLLVCVCVCVCVCVMYSCVCVCVCIVYECVLRDLVSISIWTQCKRGNRTHIACTYLEVLATFCCRFLELFLPAFINAHALHALYVDLLIGSCIGPRSTVV